MALSLSPAQIIASGQYPLLSVAGHWKRVRLGDVASVQNGFPFKSELFDRSEGVPLIRIRDIEASETEHRYRGEFDPSFLIAKGDLLIGMDGDFRAAKWRGAEALLNQRVCRVTLTSDSIHPSFFFMTLQPYLNAINAETSSVTVKHLSSRTIEDVPLPLPPIAEQRRIVAKIEELFSELDASAESLTRARAQLKTYRQSLLKAAFEGKLTADWRAANAARLEPLDRRLERIGSSRDDRFARDLELWRKGKRDTQPTRPTDLTQVDPCGQETALPREWLWCGVEGILYESLSNGRSVKDKKGGFPVLRLSALNGGNIDLTDYKEGDWEEADAKKWIVQKGDFLVARGNGSLHLVGIGALVRKASVAVAYPDTIIRLPLDDIVIDPEFFGAVWNSRLIRCQIEAAARTTAGIYKINQPHICGFSFPLPPLEEQRATMERLTPKLDVVERQEAELRTSLIALVALRQSILKRAFSGSLVPQDPADEPAAALLARLRAEDAAPARKTRRKLPA